LTGDELWSEEKGGAWQNERLEQSCRREKAGRRNWFKFLR